MVLFRGWPPRSIFSSYLVDLTFEIATTAFARQHPRRIDRIDRIIPDVAIQVQRVLVPDGVSLQEPPDPRGVGAGLVVPEGRGAGEAGLAGEAEAGAGVGSAGRLAVGVVGVGTAHDRAGAVGQGDGGVLVVGLEPPPDAGRRDRQRKIAAFLLCHCV